MRLPQDRILHIDTEFKDGKVNLVAEWQGELVRCKDCKHRPRLKNENHSDYGFNVIGDETCPCVNEEDGWYSWMPKDNFYCGFGERR